VAVNHEEIPVSHQEILISHRADTIGTLNYDSPRRVSSTSVLVFRLFVGQSDCGPKISERRVVGPQPRHQAGAQQLWRQSLCALAVLRRQRQRIELHHQVAGRLTGGGIVGDRVHLTAATGDEATGSGAIAGESLGGDFDLARIAPAASAIQPVDAGLDLRHAAPGCPQALQVPLLRGIGYRWRGNNGRIPAAGELTRRGGSSGDAGS